MDIIVEHLNYSFGEHTVFSDFSMRIPEGAAACIMGASGCGKTTLLRLLTGQLTDYSGTILGMERRRCSVVFQDDLLCEDFSAKVNIKLACSRGCYPDHSAPTEKSIRTHLASVGLADIADKPVSQLSGGMKRRVAIVRAMLSDSSLLLMDEPFKGLDEATRQQVIRYVMNEKGNRTLIAVTHDPDEAQALGCTVIRL